MRQLARLLKSCTCASRGLDDYLWSIWRSDSCCQSYGPVQNQLKLLELEIYHFFNNSSIKNCSFQAAPQLQKFDASLPREDTTCRFVISGLICFESQSDSVDSEKRKAKDYLGHKRYMTTAHGRALQQCEKLDAPLPAQPTPYTATGPLCEHKTLRILWRKEATSLYGLSLNSPVRETKHVRIMKRWADLRAALRTQNLNSRCRSRADGGSLLMRRLLLYAM